MDKEDADTNNADADTMTIVLQTFMFWRTKNESTLSLCVTLIVWPKNPVKKMRINSYKKPLKMVWVDCKANSKT